MSCVKMDEDKTLENEEPRKNVQASTSVMKRVEEEEVVNA